MEDKKSRKEELDDFWDISMLLPGSRRPPSPRRPGSTDTVELTIDPPMQAEDYSDVSSKPLALPRREAGTGNGNNESIQTAGKVLPDKPMPGPVEQDVTRNHHRTAARNNAVHDKETESTVIKNFIPPHTAQDFVKEPRPDDEYVPEHPLLHRVSIYNRKSNYNYYEQFLHHARAVVNLRGSECRHVPFFSYVPQFSQLDREQLAWYLWWRQCAAAGNFKKTDYSYILLFIYEIINTAGHGNPEWGRRMLASLWRAYRSDYIRLDRLLGEWICDFSLIHHLPATPEITAGIPTDALASCSLKEYYMANGGESPEAYSDMLITYCSNYDYRRSKFAVGDSLPLFDKHIRGALAETVKRFSGDGRHLLGKAGLEDSRVTRDAFAGALCSYVIKKKIEVDYCSFSRTHELRFLVSDIIKYSENKLRGLIGIKSRLSIYALPTPMRECIDEYFAGVAPKKKKEISADLPDYEKNYDVPASPVSLERAAEIEQLSWETTEKLISAFGETENDDDETLSAGTGNPASESNLPTENDGPGDGDIAPPKMPADASPAEIQNPISIMPQKADSPGGLPEALGELLEFVSLCASGDIAGQREFARRRGELPELVADTVNALAADIIGDIILEECDGGYALIEDYRELFPSL